MGGGLSSYGIVLMLIAFLQTPELYRNGKLGLQLIVFCGFFGGAPGLPLIAVQGEGLKVSHFDYMQLGVAPKLPEEPIEKPAFCVLPPEQIYSQPSVVIRDPVCPTRNVAHATWNIIAIRNMFRQLHRMLTLPCHCCASKNKRLCRNYLDRIFLG